MLACKMIMFTARSEQALCRGRSSDFVRLFVFGGTFFVNLTVNLSLQGTVL